MRHKFSSLLLMVAVGAMTGSARADVKTVRAPEGGAVPEVAVDADGVIHMTYGHGLPGNGYYVRSSDGGKTFTRPVQLNRHQDTVTTGMERGPKIALGKGGVIHVTWLGYYQNGGGVWYTRSTDGGQTFEPERNILDTETGVDNATVAADQDGNVFVLWGDGRLGSDPKSPVASPIFMARSADNGKTFSKNEAVKHDYPGRACGCCRLEARVGADDNLYIAFRGGYRNLRDPYLLKGPKGENHFTSVRVSADNWNFG